MLTLAIILLIVFGIVLLLLEFFVIPGVTIAGIGGVILISSGVFMSYSVFGSTTGHFFLAGSLLASIITLIYVLRSNTWKRLGLKNIIDGKTQSDLTQLFHEGDEGISLTRLAPMGKVLINEHTVEAKSMSGFIDQQKPVTVAQVLPNMLIIKLKE